MLLIAYLLLLSELTVEQGDIVLQHLNETVNLRVSKVWTEPRSLKWMVKVFKKATTKFVKEAGADLTLKRANEPFGDQVKEE